jgi:alpha-N-arabinofuranosidase
MPANNVKGFRPEVLAQLKSLHSGMYRWGGNYISSHDWRDAIGDIDKRPPRWDNVWNAIQPNDIGNDEFLQLCEMLGVEPLLTVNAGFGEARSAADMVEYVNGSISTPMGKLRAANGHPAPYKVKWWMIGNEMWGEWQFGRMVDSQYAVKHNMFAKAMRKVDPSITLIADGNIPVRPEDLGVVNKDFNWTMFTKCLDNMDLMSEHWYVTAGQRHAPAQDKNAPAEETLVESVRQPADVTKGKFEAYDEYYKRLPDLKARKIGMIIDEWAFMGGRNRGANLMQAIGNALVLQEMFRRTDLVKMGGHTSALSSIEYGPDGAALNAVGLTFKLYSDHFGAIPVQVGGNSPQPAPKYPASGDQPSVTSGSPTYPLDVSAALSKDGKRLTVAVVNPTESAQQLDLSFAGVNPGARGRMWTLSGPNVNAQTGLTRHEVTVKETSLNEAPKTLSVVPLSINIYEFPRQ